MSQGMWAAPRSWHMHGNKFSPGDRRSAGPLGLHHSKRSGLNSHLLSAYSAQCIVPAAFLLAISFAPSKTSYASPTRPWRMRKPMGRGLSNLQGLCFPSRAPLTHLRASVSRTRGKRDGLSSNVRCLRRVHPGRILGCFQSRSEWAPKCAPVSKVL